MILLLRRLQIYRECSTWLALENCTTVTENNRSNGCRVQRGVSACSIFYSVSGKLGTGPDEKRVTVRYQPSCFSDAKLVIFSVQLSLKFLSESAFKVKPGIYCNRSQGLFCLSGCRWRVKRWKGKNARKYTWQDQK